MKDSLCWDCLLSTGLNSVCPWVRSFEPVPGWEALRRDLQYGSKIEISYRVISCPLFIHSERVEGDSDA